MWWKQKTLVEKAHQEEKVNDFHPVIELTSMPELAQQMNLIGIAEENLRHIKSYQPKNCSGSIRDYGCIL